MSIWVLIVSLVCLYFSVKSMKSWFKSNNKMQEEFLKSIEDGSKVSGEGAFNLGILIFSVLYSGLWINFYVIAFRIFNHEWLVLSLVAVFYLLQTIYNFFKGLVMFAKKEIKSSIICRILNTIELAYIIYFIYYYVFHWSAVLR